MSLIVYQDEATATEFANEVMATEDIEGGVGPVALRYGFEEGQASVVTMAVSADGRRAQQHNWAEVDEDWIDSQIDGRAGITLIRGDDAELPDDWQWPEP